MGISIDMHVYDYFNLVKQIKDAVGGQIPEGRSLNEFVEKVLPEFGVRAGDKFVTLWNEYYEEYNGGYELFRAVRLYFGLKDEPYLGGYEWAGNANAYEIFEALEIEPLVDEEDYDE